MILGLHHVQIPIPPGSEPQAREFYCGLLGIPEAEKPEPLRARGGLWLQLGDRQVHIGADPNPPPAASRSHVAYEVTDLAQWKSTMTAHGFEWRDTETVNGLIRAETRDPFGNRIEFLQRIND
jgi:catechol 2,3-dioxygenase-like lactoylglutathione lyase family enzyme